MLSIDAGSCAAGTPALDRPLDEPAAAATALSCARTNGASCSAAALRAADSASSDVRHVLFDCAWSQRATGLAPFTNVAQFVIQGFSENVASNESLARAETTC